jgi:hypothetical protein
VRLVGVAAGGGGDRAALAAAIAIAFKETNRTLEPGDSREPFGRHPDDLPELPFHVPASHAGVFGHAIDRHEAVRSLDLANGFRKPRVHHAIVDQRDERLLGEHGSLGEVWCSCENRLQLLRSVCRQVFAATLDRLQWLSGNWSGGTTASTSEERWTPASGGSMLAVSRTMRSDSVSAFEFLCIAERAGGLVYTAMPNGRTPATDFTLTAIDDSSATFENPSHDFPKMIRYALKPDGTLEATISGGAGQKPTTFTFKRQE